MRILHVTPHLPPDQAANALLPAQLGGWAHERGDDVEYVAHPPRAGGSAALAGPVTWIPRRTGTILDRALHLGPTLAALRMRRVLAPAIARADVVHVHSNGLLAEVAVLLARRSNKPVVLTLYGTEIWHYAPKRFSPDLFTRAYHEASFVTFYSDRLMGRAHALGLGRRNARVVYPPVGPGFAFHDEEAQGTARARTGHQQSAPAAERQAVAPARRPENTDRSDDRRGPRISGHAPGALWHGAAARSAESRAHDPPASSATSTSRGSSTTPPSPATALPPTCSCCRRFSKRCRRSPSKRSRAARPSSRPTTPAASS